MLISPAFAQAGGAAPGFDFISLLPLVLIFVVFYFLLIRPQQKKMKAHRDMVGALKRGDKVLTSGGIIGTIVKVEEHELLVEIAKDVRVRVARGMVSDLVGKPEPARATAAPAEAPAAGGGGGGGSGPAPAGGPPKSGLMSQLFGKK